MKDTITIAIIISVDFNKKEIWSQLRKEKNVEISNIKRHITF